MHLFSYTNKTCFGKQFFTHLKSVSVGLWDFFQSWFISVQLIKVDEDRYSRYNRAYNDGPKVKLSSVHDTNNQTETLQAGVKVHNTILATRTTDMNQECFNVTECKPYFGLVIIKINPRCLLPICIPQIFESKHHKHSGMQSSYSQSHGVVTYYRYQTAAITDTPECIHFIIW